MDADVKLSYIIVNYKTPELTEKAIQSIKSKKQQKYEIIIIDNSPGEIKIREDESEIIKYVANKNNVGFAVANNQGFDLAQGKYIFMLNSDAWINNGEIKEFLAPMEENEKIGAMTPVVLNTDGSIQHPCYVRYPSIMSEFIDLALPSIVVKKLNYRLYELTKRKMEVAHACGCSLLLRKDTLSKVGSLDEKLKFSYEDVDICRRIKDAGYIILNNPSMSVVHIGGGSRKKNKTITQMWLNSKMEYYSKYHGVKGQDRFLRAIKIGAKIKYNIIKILEYLGTKNTNESKNYYNGIIEWTKR